GASSPGGAAPPKGCGERLPRPHGGRRSRRRRTRLGSLEVPTRAGRPPDPEEPPQGLVDADTRDCLLCDGGPIGGFCTLGPREARRTRGALGAKQGRVTPPCHGSTKEADGGCHGRAAA